MPIAPVPGGIPDVRFVNASGQPDPYTTLVQKHAMKMADPAFMPHMARRNVPYERSGAAHVISVNDAPRVAPEAGATLAAGRLLPPSVNRSSVFDFSSGMAEAN